MGSRAEEGFLYFPQSQLISKRVLGSGKRITCGQSECGGTVAQQIGFKSPRDRLSEIEHFDVSWKQISITGDKKNE